jgi:hypothetical protein
MQRASSQAPSPLSFIRLPRPMANRNGRGARVTTIAWSRGNAAALRSRQAEAHRRHGAEDGAMRKDRGSTEQRKDRGGDNSVAGLVGRPVGRQVKPRAGEDGAARAWVRLGRVYDQIHTRGYSWLFRLPDSARND